MPLLSDAQPEPDDSTPIYITVNVPPTDPQELGRQIARALKRYIEGGG